MKNSILGRGNFIYLAIGIFAFRVLLNFYGYNVVPFGSNADEVIIQDPALFLYKTNQFKALSFHGQLIDVIVSHHPPLFIWIQSFIFQLCGFSLSTLRLPSILYSVASLVLISCALWMLPSARLASRSVINLFIFLLLLDPNYLSWSRFGRHDTLSNFLMAAALALLFFSYSNSSIPANACKRDSLDTRIKERMSLRLKPSHTNAVLLVSAVLVGLSLSAHLQSVYGYLFYIGFMVLIGRKYLAIYMVSLCAIIPLIILVVLWTCAFQDNIPYSLEVFNTIQSGFTGDRNWIDTVSSLFADNRFNAQRFSKIGGSLLTFHLLAYAIALTCLVMLLYDKLFPGNIKRAALNKSEFMLEDSSRPIAVDSWLYLGIASLLLQLILILFKFGLVTSRFYCFFPVTIVTMPVLLDWLINRDDIGAFAQSFARFALSAIIISNIGLLASYANLVQSRLATNNYDQVHEALEPLSASIKNGMAGPPVFWLAAHQLMPNKNIQIIDNGFFIENSMSTEKRFSLIKDQDLDIAILREKSALSSLFEAANSGYQRLEKNIIILGGSYRVYGIHAND